MPEPQLCVFTKHLAGRPLSEVMAGLRERSGVDAVDLAVRPGGHVEPERVAEELPRLAEALAAAGVAIRMVTTGITGIVEPHAEATLRAVADLGVRHYKLGYWFYRRFGSLRELRTEVAASLRDLAALNRELGLTAGMHNHSDTFFGANLGDIERVLDGIEPRDVGLYFDPMHAVVEGGSAGWRMALDPLVDRVVMLAVKDFRWAEGTHRYAGARRHSVEFVPLAQGNVPWAQVLGLLVGAGFDGPVSLHSEYQGSSSFRDCDLDGVVALTATDARLLRRWWDGVAA